MPVPVPVPVRVRVRAPEQVPEQVPVPVQERVLVLVLVQEKALATPARTDRSPYRGRGQARVTRRSHPLRIRPSRGQHSTTGNGATQGDAPSAIRLPFEFSLTNKAPRPLEPAGAFGS